MNSSFVKFASDFIDTDRLPRPKNCSLYRAINWILYKESILEECFNVLAHPERITFSDHRPVYYSVNKNEKKVGVSYISVPSYPNPFAEHDFESAKDALRIFLLSGAVNASGKMSTNYALGWNDIELSIPSNYPKYVFYGHSREYSKIPSKFWAKERCAPTEMDGMSNTLTRQPLSFDDCFQFIDVIVDVKSLMAAFSDQKQNTQSERRGRPILYNWDDFFRQIIIIANSIDGLPDKQAELELAMLEWCENNWPRCPAESMIRNKISPIYQSLKKAKK